MKTTGCVSGCLGLVVLGAVFVTLCAFLYGLLAGVGDAVLPERYREAYRRWLRGLPPDDPAFVVVNDTGTRPFPCRPSEMAWPVVDQGFFTQPFIPGEHAGVDIGLVEGTPVGAPADGTVVWAGWDYTGYGNLVIVASGDARFYLAHLSEIAVEVGQSVEAGEIIGLSGNTGRSTGPHLHFEVRVNGAPVDPFEMVGKEVCPELATGPTGGGARRQVVPAVTWRLPAGMRGYALQATLDPSPAPGAALVLARRAGGALFVWPDGRPTLALEGGAVLQNTNRAAFGPQPGEVWGTVALKSNTETLISVWEVRR